MIIARGIFQWDGRERQTDRYGTFAITAHDEDAAFVQLPQGQRGEKVVFSDFTADDQHAFLNLDEAMTLEGEYVNIKAKVIETRTSRHLGDQTRKIYPSTPDVGEIIDLGEGEFFIERSTWEAGETCGDVFIGLKPLNGRDRDWFDPRKLYRLHCQTVEITVEVRERPAKVKKAKPTMDSDGFTAVLEPIHGTNFMQIKRLW